jgi:hypothetical protein
MLYIQFSLQSIESEMATILLERTTFLTGLKRRTLCALRHALVINISSNVFDSVY